MSSFQWHWPIPRILSWEGTYDITSPVDSKLSQLAFYKTLYQKAWLLLETIALSPWEGQLGVHWDSVKALAIIMKVWWCVLPWKMNQSSPASFCSWGNQSQGKQPSRGFLFSIEEDKSKFTLVMIQKMWIDKGLDPVVPFTFKGAGAGWVTAQRHTNECVPRAISLLSTHTMGPFVALS